MLDRLRRQLARKIREKRKAIAAGISQLLTTGISWIGLHVGLSVDPATAAWLAGTIGAAVTAAIVHWVTNDLSPQARAAALADVGIDRGDDPPVPPARSHHGRRVG